MSFTIDKAKVITYPPSALRSFRIYGFEWIDNLHFIRSPAEFLPDPGAYIEAARAQFLEAGWDGDGQIGLLWLPPFVFPMVNRIPPEGVVLWHVKQQEDGVSWLLSPVELPFEEFRGHSEAERMVEGIFRGIQGSAAEPGVAPDHRPPS